MAAQLSTKTIWNGMVSWIDQHAEMAAFKEMTPKPLQIVRGPRSPGWIDTAAPVIIVDCLRDEAGDEPSQKHVHRLLEYFQITIVGRGKDPFDADDMALDIKDTLLEVFKGQGALFGQHANKVNGSDALASGWDQQERQNANLSVWVHNRRVYVGP